MSKILEDIRRLLELYDNDGKDGYSAFTIDPNEYDHLRAMCDAIETLRRYVDVHPTQTNQVSKGHCT